MSIIDYSAKWNSSALVCMMVAAIGIIIITVLDTDAATKAGFEKNGLALIGIQEGSLPGKATVVATNRWRPEKCMWIVRKEDFARSNVNVVFPFTELSGAVCHILVGESDTHYCFIHLTPLTSLFRRDTNEIEKILTNLAQATSSSGRWSFRVYHFPDNGWEEPFRTVIGKVLGQESVVFTQLVPTDYTGGALNLVLSPAALFYSVQDVVAWEYEDMSTMGTFNVIPIEAIE